MIPIFAYFYSLFFFFNDTATTEIYTLSLHDALPICHGSARRCRHARHPDERQLHPQHHDRLLRRRRSRSEEHTSELQSRENLVCRLLLEKKKEKRLKYNDQNKEVTR